MNDIYKLPLEEMWFLLKCYDDYVIDYCELHDEYSVPVCLKEFYDNEYTEFYEHYLDYLWEDLGYIPIDEEENIDEDFYIWEKGTFREVIWRWFDERVFGGIGNRYFN